MPDGECEPPLSLSEPAPRRGEAEAGVLRGDEEAAVATVEARRGEEEPTRGDGEAR